MKFSGKIGIWLKDIPRKPGDDVYISEIREEPVRGNIIIDSRRFQNVSDQLNQNFISNTRISILARGYCKDHWMNIKYVIWQGKRVEVTSAQYNHPRITLELGGMYHGEVKRTTERDS